MRQRVCWLAILPFMVFLSSCIAAKQANGTVVILEKTLQLGITATEFGERVAPLGYVLKSKKESKLERTELYAPPEPSDEHDFFFVRVTFDANERAIRIGGRVRSVQVDGKELTYNTSYDEVVARLGEPDRILDIPNGKGLEYGDLYLEFELGRKLKGVRVGRE